MGDSSQEHCGGSSAAKKKLNVDCNTTFLFILVLDISYKHFHTRLGS